MLREQKGITLVALVITIIVLLILAGVSISLVVGNNGVLTRASGAVVSNTAAGIAEDIQLAFATAEMEYQYAAAGNPGQSRAPFYGTDSTTGTVGKELEKGTMKVLVDLDYLGDAEENSILLDDKGETITLSSKIKANTYGKDETNEAGKKPTVFIDGKSYVVSFKETGNTTETYFFLLEVNGGAKAELIGYVKDETLPATGNPYGDVAETPEEQTPVE